MAPQQLRAMWAKRNHPQPSNPKLMDVRVAGGQPVRAVDATSRMLPWQLWHCIAIVPSVATALPIAPRRHFVAEPGWQV
mgnify:CR=1 FL=1